MIKIAMLSFWHVHAKDYARQAANHPETKIVAAWDEDPERGKTEASKLQAEYYESLDSLLSNPEIDAVIVNAPTSMHRDVIVQAAQAGKHIFTEKVLASTLKQCNEILEAVNENGVALVVSLPRINDDYTLAIQNLLNRGLLGKVTLVRTRLSHNGAIAGWLPDHFYNKEQCGGGALIDLGCHPMYLTRLFLGQMPEQVSASYGFITGKEVEDNAVSVLTCQDGSIGIAEAGFVNSHSPFTIEVHGTDGTALYSSHDGKLLVRSNIMQEMKDQWNEIEMPPKRMSAFEQWVQHINDGTTADANIELAVDLTKLMEASNLSAASGQAVRIEQLQK